MRLLFASALTASSLLVLLAPSAHAETSAEDAPSRATSHGDLFPGRGRPTVSAATGLPFFGIAEVGIGVTNGFAIGALGGITPSVVTAGIRPRLRLATSEHTAL